MPTPDARLTAPLEPPASGTIVVAFLLSPGAEVVDFTGPWGVFDYVLLGADWRKPFDLYTVAADTMPVRVSGGMRILPDHGVADAPAPDLVVVPAMDTEAVAPEVLEWLRQVHQRTAVTMSVCNGSFVLGMAGLLEGRDVTAHHHGYGSLRAMFPAANVVRGVRYVEDGRLATSGGLTSGIDLALRVVERYFGREVAEATAARLEYQGVGWKHPDSNAQWVNPPVGTPEQPLCPVCEMSVDRGSALALEIDGRTWYFCGEWCRDRFAAAPERFASV